MSLVVKYGEDEIINAAGSCSKVLRTQGKMMAEDVEIEYSDEMHKWLNKNLINFVCPSGISKIPKEMFLGHDLLESVLFKDNSLIEIGDSAFQNCLKLKNIVLPNSLVTIGASAFKGAGIDSISLPNQITTIGDSCFRQSMISNIDLGHITIIPNNCFYGCQKLKYLKIPATVTAINNYFAGGISNIIIDCTELTTSNGQVNTIASSLAFYGFGSIYSPTKHFVFATEEIANIYKQATNWVSIAGNITYVGAES